jgi:surface protein
MENVEGTGAYHYNAQSAELIAPMFTKHSVFNSDEKTIIIDKITSYEDGVKRTRSGKIYPKAVVTKNPDNASITNRLDILAKKYSLSDELAAQALDQSDDPVVLTQAMWLSTIPEFDAFPDIQLKNLYKLFFIFKERDFFNKGEQDAADSLPRVWLDIDIRFGGEDARPLLQSDVRYGVGLYGFPLPNTAELLAWFKQYVMFTRESWDKVKHAYRRHSQSNPMFTLLQFSFYSRIVTQETNLLNFWAKGSNLQSFVLPNMAVLPPVLNQDDFTRDLLPWLSDSLYDMHFEPEDPGHISNWDVSEITEMRGAFWTNLEDRESQEFNQDISRWDVSNVYYMDYMFHANTNFNQDISGWNVSSLISAKGMFRNTKKFDVNLSAWNVSELVYTQAMFENSIFNNGGKPLTWGDKLSKVTNMSYMFHQAKLFNSDISGWNTESVTTMQSMFNGAWIFNRDLDNWNLDKVVNMDKMFYRAEGFAGNILSWKKYIGHISDAKTSVFEKAYAFRNTDQFAVFFPDSENYLDDAYND